MNEEEMFEELLNNAVKEKSDDFPEHPSEFDIHVDSHYNVFMFIKGSWTKTGLNVTPL